MKSEEIKALFAQFELAAAELEGVECCSARELQDLLGYSKWENFEKVIQKGKDACRNAGEEVEYHFPDVRKMVLDIFACICTSIFCFFDYFFKIFPFTIS